MFKKLSITAACVVLVSAALSVDATAAGPHRVARGKTGQGRSIRIAVAPRQLKLRGFAIELRCSGGYLLVDQESGFLPTVVSPGGRFHDHQYGSTDEVLIRGRAHGHAVHGRVRVRDRLGKHRCSSPWVRFTAKVG
jgi:hypothetical protein